MRPTKYGTKAAYVAALHDLQARAERTGWNLTTATTKQLACFHPRSRHRPALD